MLLPALNLFGGGKYCLQQSSSKQFVSVRSADTFFLYLFNKLRAYACEAPLRMPISHALLRGNTNTIYNYLNLKTLIMRKFTFKSLLIAAALCLGTSARAQITTFPTSEKFDDGTTGIFTGGTIVSTNNIGNVLSIHSGTSEAIAAFDSDNSAEGNQAYSIGSTDKITISFTMYAGWLSGGQDTKFAVKNSEGIELFSYTYNAGNCNVTNVSVGGTTVSKFAAFNAQSKSSSKNANGFDNGKSQGYVATDGNNTIVTITISGSGVITASFVKTAAGLDKTFSGVISKGTAKDLASLNITSSVSIADRACGFDNFTISKETVKEVMYTVKGMCGETELYSNTLYGVVDDVPTVTKEAYFDGEKNKYIYQFDDAAQKTIKEDGSTVVTVNYRKAELTAYTVVAKCSGTTLETIATGNIVEGESAPTVYYHKALKKDDKWYVINQKAEPYYGIVVSAGDNDIEYTLNENVTYFTEVEDMTVVQKGNYEGWRNDGLASRSSAGQAPRHYGKNYAYTNETIPAGIYTISMNARNQSSKNTANITLGLMDEEGNVTYLSETFEDWATSQTSEKVVSVTIPVERRKFVIYGGDGNSNLNMDFLLFTKTADIPASVSATVGNSGIATFCSPYVLDFTNAKNIKAYTASVSEAKVKLTETKSVAAGEGVIIKSVNGGKETEEITVSTNAVAATEGNALVGTLVDIDPLPTDETKDEAVVAKNYILNNGTQGIGFYLAADNKVAAGKAYLRVPEEKVAGAKALTIVWNDGETTGIKDNYEFGTMNSDAATFDLSGRKVANPAKGLYIKNGKKFIVK